MADNGFGTKAFFNDVLTLNGLTFLPGSMSRQGSFIS